jgi:polyferredoxin
VAARNPEKPEVERPRRPTLVEVAAAILIVGSVTDVLISFEGMATAPSSLGRVLYATSVSLGLLLAILGFLLRSGRAWLVTLNIVAVAAFLELLTLSVAGILSALFDMLVVGILLRERWWFQWVPPNEPTEVELGRERERA